MNTITRREFAKRGGLLMMAFASGVSFLTGGCNVFQDIENWTAVGERAIASLQATLAANGINAGTGTTLGMILNDILAALAALNGAAAEYLAVTPPPVGTIAKIQTLFQSIVDNFGKFLTQLALPGSPLLTLVSALVGLLLSTIAGFVNRLPAPAGAAAAYRGQFEVRYGTRAGTQTIRVTPTSRTRRAFKHGWNNTLHSSSVLGLKIPPSAYLHVSLLEHL